MQFLIFTILFPFISYFLHIFLFLLILSSKLKKQRSQLSGWSDEPGSGGSTPPLSSSPKVDKKSPLSSNSQNTSTIPPSVTSTQKPVSNLSSSLSANPPPQTTIPVSSTTTTSTPNPTTVPSTSTPSAPVIDKSKLSKEERRALFQQQAVSFIPL